MKIVVLAGGISTEREISIVSGTQVWQGTSKQRSSGYPGGCLFQEEKMQIRCMLYR